MQFNLQIHLVAYQFHLIPIRRSPDLTKILTNSKLSISSTSLYLQSNIWISYQHCYNDMKFLIHLLYTIFHTLTKFQLQMLHRLHKLGKNTNPNFNCINLKLLIQTKTLNILFKVISNPIETSLYFKNKLKIFFLILPTNFQMHLISPLPFFFFHLVLDNCFSNQKFDFDLDL